MILWIDARLSPVLARRLSGTSGVTAHAMRDLGLRDAKDPPNFHAAREAGAVIMGKDSDFVLLLERFGPPPQILWATCGNTSNARLRDIPSRAFQKPEPAWNGASHSSRSVMRVRGAGERTTPWDCVPNRRTQQRSAADAPQCRPF
jgi:predicted nuclease of predicted toxin-antitoxin system